MVTVYMFSLQDISKEKMVEYRQNTKIAQASVADISSWLWDQSKAYLLVDQKIGEVGYCVVTEQLKDQRYSATLIDLAVSKDYKVSMFRILPNIYRQLQLDSVLIKSDDCRFLQTILHFSCQMSHIFQVYEPQVSIDKKSEIYRKLSLTPLIKSAIARTARKREFKIFHPDILCEDSVLSGYNASFGSKSIGEVMILDTKYMNLKFIFPFVKKHLRRQGWGSILCAMVAQKIKDSGARPAMVVKPEDEIGLRFVSKIKAQSIFDLLHVRPKFHVTPIFPDNED